jgi:hypothetical protein
MEVDEIANAMASEEPEVVQELTKPKTRQQVKSEEASQDHAKTPQDCTKGPKKQGKVSKHKHRH